MVVKIINITFLKLHGVWKIIIYSVYIFGKTMKIVYYVFIYYKIPLGICMKN